VHDDAMHGRGGGELSARTDVALPPHFAACLLALFAVRQVPLYWVQYPDIRDFPNHLARLHTLLRLPQVSVLQRYYELRGAHFSTNIGMEVLVPALAAMADPALALKLYGSLATLALTSGAVVLARSLRGRIGHLQLGVLLFANSANFQLGLFNYLFGVGAAFWLLAAWIAGRGPVGIYHWFAFATGCVAMYLCHLAVLGIYAVGVLAHKLGLRGNLICGSPRGAPGRAAKARRRPAARSAGCDG
jgi:hypothetical protein